MKIFGLKNCDKCRLALKTLLSSGVNVSLIDVRSDGISVEQLERFYKKFGFELVNKRSFMPKPACLPLIRAMGRPDHVYRA